ncbi:hypothetical protein A2955_03045 [Candidatus Woesebacteria bacterium RIFCSPLOWO2_01_FULL_37_19]|uniref:Uncharacterized protein n=1 Tax=Candidatus Woesebacteria bacterium RIFCSPLOWO2_01_FULL_37_19 TaxID=1802514 RepID=A0A1F8BDP6_9BACT|nr:MAG: hypothetical protein A2955_03045 [Candidatus Woesebacteria bacterium RIFCSPLOWO2_01_FULL_37_19]
MSKIKIWLKKDLHIFWLNLIIDLSGFGLTFLIATRLLRPLSLTPTEVPNFTFIDLLTLVLFSLTPIVIAFIANWRLNNWIQAK